MRSVLKLSCLFATFSKSDNTTEIDKSEIKPKHNKTYGLIPTQSKRGPTGPVAKVAINPKRG